MYVDVVILDGCVSWGERLREINGHLIATEILRSGFRSDNNRWNRDSQVPAEMAEATNGAS